MTEIVAVLSGGMDSTIALEHTLTDKTLEGVDCISFDYGQKHKKELTYAKATADRLNLKHDVIDLSGLTKHLATSKSSLISVTDVPEGHYAEDNMKSTVVPNRNMIMMSIAGGIAVARGARAILIGVHSGDHFVYPDCRPEFVDVFDDALYHANLGFGKLDRWPTLRPFMYDTKADIAYHGIELNVDFSKTWSCYKGGDRHCGKCGTCVERLEAIDEALGRAVTNGLMHQSAADKYDTTEYEDRLGWKELIAQAQH